MTWLIQVGKQKLFGPLSIGKQKLLRMPHFVKLKCVRYTGQVAKVKNRCFRTGG